jgi:Ca-activated chloride channel homolog
MKTIALTFFLAVFIFIASFDCAYAANPDRLYKKGQYKEALSAYEKLDIEHPKDVSFRFNKGCAAYQLKDYKTAQTAFASVYQRAKDNNMRFKAAYNLGNTVFQAGDMKSGVSFYKEALRMNPQSVDARYNLELALRKIKEEEDKKKQQQQNQQDNKNQDKEDNKKQDHQDQNNKDSDQQKNQQDQKQQGDKGKDKEKQQSEQQGQDKKQQQQPQKLSGELKALNTSGQNKEGKKGSKKQQAKSPDKTKAEALLGNIQEDRSRFLQHQAPEDNQGPKSGKYW